MKGALHKILSELHFPSLSPILWPGANFPRAFCKLEKILHFCSISSQIWAKKFHISLRKTFHHRMSTSNLRKSGAKQGMWAFRTKKGTSHTYDLTSEDKLQIHLSKVVPIRHNGCEASTKIMVDRHHTCFYFVVFKVRHKNSNSNWSLKKYPQPNCLMPMIWHLTTS